MRSVARAPAGREAHDRAAAPHEGRHDAGAEVQHEVRAVGAHVEPGVLRRLAAHVQPVVELGDAGVGAAAREVEALQLDDAAEQHPGAPAVQVRVVEAERAVEAESLGGRRQRVAQLLRVRRAREQRRRQGERADLHERGQPDRGRFGCARGRRAAVVGRTKERHGGTGACEIPAPRSAPV
jgi:hypothetical protein